MPPSEQTTRGRGGAAAAGRGAHRARSRPARRHEPPAAPPPAPGRLQPRNSPPARTLPGPRPLLPGYRPSRGPLCRAPATRHGGGRARRAPRRPCPHHANLRAPDTVRLTPLSFTPNAGSGRAHAPSLARARAPQAPLPALLLSHPRPERKQAPHPLGAASPPPACTHGPCAAPFPRAAAAHRAAGARAGPAAAPLPCQWRRAPGRPARPARAPASRAGALGAARPRSRGALKALPPQARRTWHHVSSELPLESPDHPSIPTACRLGECRGGRVALASPAAGGHRLHRPCTRRASNSFEPWGATARAAGRGPPGGAAAAVAGAPAAGGRARARAATGPTSPAAPCVRSDCVHWSHW
jgi:hypothetical protein